MFDIKVFLNPIKWTKFFQIKNMWIAATLEKNYSTFCQKVRYYFAFEKLFD